jgi:hypothetical protein
MAGVNGGQGVWWKKPEVWNLPFGGESPGAMAASVAHPLHVLFGGVDMLSLAWISNSSVFNLGTFSRPTLIRFKLQK